MRLTCHSSVARSQRWPKLTIYCLVHPSSSSLINLAPISSQTGSLRKKMKAIIFLGTLVLAAVVQAELVTEEVTFNITIGGVPSGLITIALFGQTVPKTVKNFATICSEGVNGKTYAGSPFHRVIKNFMNQGGDIVSGDGYGQVSIYGPKFDDENFDIKHTGPGLISMANAGPNTNGCQFFITTTVTSWLDGYHVVFGKVTDGMDLVYTIGSTATDSSDRPIKPVLVAQCTRKILEDPYDLPLP